VEVGGGDDVGESAGRDVKEGSGEGNAVGEVVVKTGAEAHETAVVSRRANTRNRVVRRIATHYSRSGVSHRGSAPGPSRSDLDVSKLYHRGAPLAIAAPPRRHDASEACVPHLP